MNYEDVISGLPNSFRNDIMSHNQEENRINIRSTVKDLADSDLWMKEFSESTKTKWTVRDIERDSYNFSLCIIHVCHRSNFHKTSTEKSEERSNEHCQCVINFLIKKYTKRTKKMDPYVREGLVAIITINYNHNHPPEEVKCPEPLLEITSEETQSQTCDAAEASETDKVEIIEAGGNLGTCDSEETLYSTLKANLPRHITKENIVAIKENPFVTALITPVMLRAQQLPFAKDIVFVDTVVIDEKSKFAITFLLTQSAIGAIPLTVIVLAQRTNKHIKEGFKLVKEYFGPHSFCGQHYPSTIMSDDSDGERFAMKATWPDSQLLLCRFNLPRGVRQWLSRRDNNIEKQDRAVLLKMFLDMLMSMSVPDAEAHYLVAIGSIVNFAENIPQKYPHWVQYVNVYWERREEWCLAYRNECIRGNHTNNFSKTFIRLFKDKVLGKCKSCDIVSLVQHTCTEMERYYVSRLMHFSIGRVDIARLFLKKQLKSSDYIRKNAIESLGDRLYLVPSKSDNEETFTVDASVGYCNCESGKFGIFCEHIAAVHRHFGEMPPNLPPVTTDARYSVAVLAKGKHAPDISFFTPLHPTVEDGLTLKNEESVEIINKQSFRKDVKRTKSCEVPNCEIRNYAFSREQKKLMKNNIALSIHKIPTAVHNNSWKSWIEEAGIQDWSPSTNGYICSLHFHDYCFNLKNELLESAVPSVYFENFRLHVNKLLNDINPDYNISDDDDNEEDINEVPNTFSFDTSVIRTDDNEEVIECTLLPKNKDDYKLLDRQDPSTLERDIFRPKARKVNNHRVIKRPVTPSGPQDTAKKLFSMIKSGTFDRIPTVDPSLETVVYHLLNTLKVANANNNQSSTENQLIPNIYIIVNKLSETDVDPSRKVVLMTTSDIVAMVNDLLQSIKGGANVFINSKDVTIICGNPAMFFIKYISVKNCDPSMNSVYVITTENLEPYVKIVRKDSTEAGGKGSLRLVQRKPKQLLTTKTYRQIKPKSDEVDESSVFKKGEKWFVCSPLKNANSPILSATSGPGNTLLVSVPMVNANKLPFTMLNPVSQVKVVRKVPIPRITQIENIIIDSDLPSVEDEINGPEQRGQKRKLSDETQSQNAEESAEEHAYIIDEDSDTQISEKSAQKTDEGVEENTQKQEKGSGPPGQKMQKLKKTNDTKGDVQETEAKKLEQDAIQFFVGKMKGASSKVGTKLRRSGRKT